MSSNFAEKLTRFPSRNQAPEGRAEFVFRNSTKCGVLSLELGGNHLTMGNLAVRSSDGPASETELTRQEDKAS